VWWLFLTAVPFKLLNDGAQFVGPFFLNKLLDVIQDGGSQVPAMSQQLLVTTLSRMCPPGLQLPMLNPLHCVDTILCARRSRGTYMRP
jgi:hypothetical protein